MSRLIAVILGVVTLSVFAYTPSEAQRPSSSRWVRSAELYMKLAREKSDPTERRDLFQQALDVTIEGIQESPENPRHFLIAGEVMVNLGDYAGADTMFTRAQQMFPGYVEDVSRQRNNAWILAYNSGVQSLQSGDLETAERQFRRADVIYQGRPEARTSLGVIYTRQGDNEQAAEAYAGALEILRGPAREGLSPDDEARWAQLEQAATFNLAQVLTVAGDYQAAANAYRDFLARVPDDIVASINLGVVLSRMGEEEAAADIYAELSEREDLDEAAYLQIGIGLFGGDRFDRAADAFRTVLDLNPYNRAALFNLANTLYELSRRALADPAAGDLVAIYTELRDVTTRLREMDPANRQILALYSQAVLGLADNTDDQAQADRLRREVQSTREQHDALAFEVADLNLRANEGTAQVSGQVRNFSVPAGQPLTLRVHIIGMDGSSIGTEEITITAPGPDELAAFETEIPLTGEPAGWRYEVAG